MLGLLLIISAGFPLKAETPSLSFSFAIQDSRVETFTASLSLRNHTALDKIIYKPDLTTLWVKPLATAEQEARDSIVDFGYHNGNFLTLRPGTSLKFSSRIDLDIISKSARGDVPFRILYSDLMPKTSLAERIPNNRLEGIALASRILVLSHRNGTQYVRPLTLSDLNVNVPGLKRGVKIQISRNGNKLGLGVSSDRGLRKIRTVDDFRGLVRIDTKDKALAYLELQTSFQTHFYFPGSRFARFEWLQGKSDSEWITTEGSFYVAKRIVIEQKTRKPVLLTERVGKDGTYKILAVTPLQRPLPFELGLGCPAYEL